MIKKKIKIMIWGQLFGGLTGCAASFLLFALFSVIFNLEEKINNEKNFSVVRMVTLVGGFFGLIIVPKCYKEII